MIKFFRQAKREILIEFDKGGYDELLSLFSKIKETQIEKLQVQFDMSIIKNKYIGKVVSSITIEIDDAVDGAEISFVDDKIIWKIDEEYADMSFERFIECDKKQEFSPSEFMYVKVIGRKDLDYLFCDFKLII